MDFQQFYPTPPELAEKLVKLIDDEVKGLVLEPSAGVGNLADAFIKSRSRGWNNFKQRDVHCVEISPDRTAILRNKGYVVIWDDFLTFNPLTPYSVIIMNPPFRDGARHLLKALQILAPSGEIACILNAETIRNPFSNERKNLIRRLEEMGNYTVDFIPNAFDDTDVEIALIYAKKKAASKRCITFDDFKKSIVEEHHEEFQAVARHGEINGLVDNYRAEVQAALKLFDEITNFNRVALHQNSYDAVFEIKINRGNSRADIVRAINLNYWTHLLYSKELSRLLTSDAQREYSSKLHEMAEFEFNERNILQLKMDLTKNLLENIDAAIMKTWETFTSRFAFTDYSQNIHYYNGWITNKAYKVNKKVIIPLNAFDSYDGRLDTYRVSGELSDIEKAMNYLDCGRTESADIEENLRFAQTYGGTRNIDTKYFKVTLYKKGTAHLTFKDEELLKKFNLYCGKRFNWLPDDYGRKRYEDLSEKEKNVLIMRYGLDDNGQKKTLEEIGSYYGVSRERIRQIENRAMSKLKKLCRSSNINVNLKNYI